MKRLCFIVFYILISAPCVFSQQLFYSTIIKGGITGTGFGIYSNTSITKSVDIPTGSTIKRAFLIAEREREADDITVKLNGYSYLFNAATAVSQKFIGNNAPPCIGYNSTMNAIDISNQIDPVISNYTLQVPLQEEACLQGAYYGFYLYIVFENVNLPKTACCLFINNQDVAIYNSYDLGSLNPINNNRDVGLGVETLFFCDTLFDGSYISVNNDTLGLIGGNEPLEQNCTGVSPHFSYYNNNLIGIDNSISNNSMSWTDALANIKNYVGFLDTSVNVSFSYKSPHLAGRRSNPVLLLMLSYTSPCDTFSTTVTPNTTICQGESLQLNATGGQSYEWASIKDASSNDLSCTNCPNPVFTGDSSQVYTVRIWNNDSCSVVRPVQIQVAHTQKPQFVTNKATCGKSDGAIKINNTPENFSHWEALTAAGDTLALSTGNTFTQLSAGEYKVYYVDTFGCKSEDTLAVVNSYKKTVLAFVAEPLNGKAPLQVNIENNSHYADTLIWLLNGEEQAQPFTGFTADTSGNYELQLIGWQYDKSCADTVKRTIWVYDNTVVKVSEAISPNGDGKNDVFFIDQLDMFPGTKVWIYNRWGGLVYHSDNYQNDWSGTSQSQTTIGSGDKLPEGTYYYVIELGGKVVAKEEDKIKKGYVYLKR